MERRIRFNRERHMLCGRCSRHFVVDLDWIDRWEQSGETCPGCDLTCEHADAPRVTVDPEDPALDDAQVARFAWYHTSTQPNWPSKSFNPAADFTRKTRELMGGDEQVAKWVARQHAKALHVGTYEAAVHNLLRRMVDQDDRRSQFYLYRVHLKPSVIIRKGWLIDPSNWLGDVSFEEVCPPGVDIARYLNRHEDPGGLSLALGGNAISTVQQIAVPLPEGEVDEWVTQGIRSLENASRVVPPPVELEFGQGWNG